MKERRTWKPGQPGGREDGRKAAPVHPKRAPKGWSGDEPDSETGKDRGERLETIKTIRDLEDFTARRRRFLYHVTERVTEFFYFPREGE